MTQKFFKLPFGVDGDRATVPNAAQPDGSISYDIGYGPDYALDPGGGPPALNIARNTFNQLMYDMTNAIQILQVHGAPDWITSSDNDGSPYSYDIFSWVRHASALWYSLVPTNTVEPGTDATKWAQFPPPSQFNTADVIASYNTTLPSGWLWLDGKTIGNASSNGTARANPDTSTLFTALWTSVPASALQLYNSDGTTSARGGSAAADYAANKALALPDLRGRTLAAIDNLGGTAANRLTTAGSGIAGGTLAAAGGVETYALTSNQLASHAHSGTTDSAGVHHHDLSAVAYNTAGGGGGNAALQGANHAPTATIAVGTTDDAGAHTHTFTTGTAGSGLAHQNTQPTITVLYRIKL